MRTKIRDLEEVLHYFVKKAMQLSEEAFQFVAKLHCKYTYIKRPQNLTRYHQYGRISTTVTTEANRDV